MKKAFVFLIVIALSLPALADYHYASHTGSNTFPYTSWETAADSIQKAINAGTAGDTIYVGAGTWNAPAYILNDDLAMIGISMDSTTLIRTGPRAQIVFPGNRTLLEKFTFTGASVAVYPIYKTDIVIQNCTFRNLGGGIVGVFTGKIENNLFFNNGDAIDATFDACSLLVKNNTITGCTEAGIMANDGSWTVVNNLFHHNDAPNFVLMLNFHRAQDTAYVANNLFYRNQANQGHLGPSNLAIVGSTTVNNTFIGPEVFTWQRAIAFFDHSNRPASGSVNNAFSDYYAAFSAEGDPSQIYVSYNDFWDVNRVGLGGIVHLLEGNLYSSPMFADSTDFYLQAFSPLIDAGDPNILDVDGTRSDIGYLGGPGGCSYVYLDLAPKIPDSLTVRVDSGTIVMNWHYNTEADFNRYQIFRDSVSGFTPLR